MTSPDETARENAPLASLGDFIRKFAATSTIECTDFGFNCFLFEWETTNTPRNVHFSRLVGNLENENCIFPE